jgi:excisionase family DNA binding protein
MNQQTHEVSSKSPLLTTEEACEYLKISRSSLYSLVKKGLIAAVHPVAGRTAYLQADIDAFILARRVA